MGVYIDLQTLIAYNFEVIYVCQMNGWTAQNLWKIANFISSHYLKVQVYLINF